MQDDDPELRFPWALAGEGAHETNVGRNTRHRADKQMVGVAALTVEGETPPRLATRDNLCLLAFRLRDCTPLGSCSLVEGNQRQASGTEPDSANGHRTPLCPDQTTPYSKIPDERGLCLRETASDVIGPDDRKTFVVQKAGREWPPGGQ